MALRRKILTVLRPRPAADDDPIELREIRDLWVETATRSCRLRALASPGRHQENPESRWHCFYDSG
jgi:hypothetical protein